MTKHNPFDEDIDLFRSAMRNVKPLQPTTLREPKPPLKQSTNQPPKEKPNALAKQPEWILSNHYEAVGPEEVLSYAASGVPTQRLRALKNRQIPPQAQLDLHGLHTEAARDTLCHWLSQQSSLGYRTLLIIHGKGARQGGEALLKSMVNSWLRQIPPVLAFHSALPRDGGMGALYVLLRHPRKLSE